MGKKRVTLLVESEIYDKFKEYCYKNGLVLSKRFETFTDDELRKNVRK